MISVENTGLKTGSIVVQGNSTINNYYQNKDTTHPQVRFKVRDPIEHFSGRNEFLEKLHGLVSDESGKTIQSRIVVVCGMAGVGKTETVRSFILNNHKNFHNVIWLDAEDESTLNNAFNGLARQIDRTEEKKLGQLKDIQEVVEQVYATLCQCSTLIVLDNVSSGYLPNLPSEIQPFEKFLPKSTASTLVVPVIIITSRNQEWAPITKKVLPLQVFYPSESVEFIKSVLDPKNDGIDEAMAMNLSELLGNLPLALQHAVAYIWQQKNTEDTFGISEYVHLFNCEHAESIKIMDGNSFSRTDYSLTVMTTWNVSLKQLLNHDCGETASWVIVHLSFLSPNDIPVKLINATINRNNRPSVPQALRLLKDYSLITCDSDGVFVYIHRLLQFVVAEKLKREDYFNEVFGVLVSRLVKFIRRLEVKEFRAYNCLNCILPIEAKINVNEEVSSSKFDFLVSLNHLLTYSDDQLTMFRVGRKTCQLLGSGSIPDSKFPEESLKFVKDIGTLTDNMIPRSVTRQSLQPLEVLVNSNTQGPAALQMKAMISAKYESIGEFDKAYKINQEMFIIQNDTVGPHHADTLKTQHKISLLFYRQGKYVESLELQKDVYNSRYHHVHTPDWIFESSRLMVATLTALGRHLEPFAWSNEMEKIEDVGSELGQILGNDQQRGLKVLFEMSHKASILNAQTNHQEALSLFQYVHKSFTNIFGQEHPATRNAQYEVACTLIRNKQLENASQMFQNWCQLEMERFGRDSPRLVDRLKDIARLHEENGRLEDILPLVEQIHRQIHETGVQTLSATRTLQEIGKIFWKLERLDEALTDFQEAYRIMLKNFGPVHQATLESQEFIAFTYFLQKESDKARKVVQHICEVQVETQGSTNSKTIRLMSNIAALFDEQSKYHEALEMYQYVFDIQSKSLVNPVEAVAMLAQMGNCHLSLENFVEAELQYSKAVQLAAKYMGSEHACTISVANTLINVLEKQRKFEEAKKYQQIIYLNHRKLLGLLHHETRKDFRNWSRFCTILGHSSMYSEFRDDATSRMQQLGEDHPDTLASLENLAYFLHHFLRSANINSFALFKLLYDKRFKILGETDPLTMATSKMVSIASRQQNSSDPEMQKHQWITCDGCKVTGITGPRFKCVFCEDFDFCELCLHLKYHNHHHFWKIWWRHPDDIEDDHLEIHSDLVTWTPGQDGLIPDGSLVGGLDLVGKDVVIARMNYEGYWIPANLVEGEIFCRAWGKSDVTSSCYETLIVKDDDVHWINNKDIERIPGGAIVVEIMYPHLLYIGRVCQAESDQFGKVYSEPVDEKTRIVCTGVDVSSSEFEILVLKQPRTIEERLNNVHFQ